MSSCPTKDIHSVYIDGEMPVAYLAEYESHVQTCPKCAATLAQMRALSAAFKSDKDAIAKDDVFTAQSYERLMSRMRYSRVTKKATRFSDTAFKPAFFVPMAAAAAAILLAVFLPMRFSGKNQFSAQAAHTVSVAPITRSQAASVEQKNVIINGTISPSAIGTNIQKVSSAMNVALNENPQLFVYPQAQQAEATSTVFTDVDMFIPQFEKKHQLVLKVMPPASGAKEGVWTFTFSADDGMLP